MIQNIQNIQNNMEYREYLTKNADTIIKYNQVVANTNCSNTQIIPDNNLGNSSNKTLNIDYSSLIPILTINKKSFLKKDYLNNYYTMANLCSPNFL